MPDLVVFLDLPDEPSKKVPTAIDLEDWMPPGTASCHLDDIFVYDNLMDENRTIRGKQVTDEQIQAWADEAETGYDLPALRQRRRGRPAAGRGPGKPVTVRFDEQTLNALRERAQREGLANESEAIRAAVRAWSHVA